MTERYAIYYAPARGSALDARAEAWLAQADLALLTVSARRYGFHATLKAPMALAAGQSPAELVAALAAFAATRAPVAIGDLAPRLLEGFLALTPEPQLAALTAFAADVVAAFEPFRAPLPDEERARRLKAPLTPRQVELVDAYGYPYVLEQFQFHMTLTDRLPEAGREALVEAARGWFAPALNPPPMLDRLVLFREAGPGAAFERLNDYPLRGAA